MACGSSHSRKRRFTAEICIHHVGIDDIDKPATFVFPRLTVCLDCGFAEFVIEENELQQLRSFDAG